MVHVIVSSRFVVGASDEVSPSGARVGGHVVGDHPIGCPVVQILHGGVGSGEGRTTVHTTHKG